MANPNRNLFRLTRFILLRLPFLVRFFSILKPRSKNLLIIKTDAIGDYILFRNFLENIRKDHKYRDYKITLLGNNLWKQITQQYDSAFVDEFVFTSAENLYYSPFEVFKLGLKLFFGNYETVLQPAYTRTLMNDGFAGLAAAKQTVAFRSNTERIFLKYKKVTDSYYSRLIDLPESITFEFDKTRYFFETVLDVAVDLYGPQLPVNELKTGVIIFPGAGVIKRSWEREKFVEIIKLIKDNSAEKIILAGGPSEVEIGEYLTASFPDGGIENKINKTSLTELVELISSAKLIISNETSAIHIAAATKTKAVCILGGGHFGRFAPYPAYIENAPVCVYYKMECFNCNWWCIYETAATEPFPCIGNVTVDAVWQEVKQLL